MAIELKKYNHHNIFFKKKRNNLISSLSAMQFLVLCIGIKNISDEQAECILTTLKTLLNIDFTVFEDAFRNEKSSSEYSDVHYGLLLKMHSILSYCISELTSQRKGNIGTIEHYLLGFHNLPRAFLSVADNSHISPQEAWNYSKSYFKID